MLNICGIIAFLMLYIYDFNLIYFKNKFLKSFFLIGMLVIVLTTLANIIIYFPKHWDVKMFIYSFFSLLSLCGLVYTLFFALEFDEAYQNDNCNQICTKTGVYALCRHPGVLWMLLMYLFLYLAFRDDALLFMVIGYNTMNIIYVILQDMIIFPQQFIDYTEYKETVPFLVPTIKSIRACVKTIGEGQDEI